MANYDKTSLGSIIKHHREEKGLSVRALAQELDDAYNVHFDYAMLSRWENGGNITSIKLLILMDFLAFGIDEETARLVSEKYRI